jgi:signal transduction histidine kinase
MQTDDELNELADQFNKMAIALNDSYRGLEEKVIERTKIEKRRSEQLRTINEVGRKISSILSIDKLLPYVVNSLKESFHYYNVEIYTLDLNTGKISRQATTNPSSGITTPESSVIDKNSLIFKTFQTRTPLVVPDFSQEKSYPQENPEIRSAVAMPITMGRIIWGVIEVQSADINAFDDVDLFTIQTLADQIATAVTNVHLYNETRDLAVFEERNRIAREIHDTLAQGFAGIVLQLEAAEQSLNDDIKQAQEHLDRARLLARENLNEARNSVWSLHPHPVGKTTIIDDLRTLIAGFIQNTGLRVEFKVSGEQRTLHPDIEKALFRIGKEALTNVEKHARANRVDIALAFSSNTIQLSVVDDGVGFDTSIVKHDAFGLISMKERSQIFDGIMTIQSEKGRGTSIRVSIPTERRN